MQSLGKPAVMLAEQTECKALQSHFRVDSALSLLSLCYPSPGTRTIDQQRSASG